MSAPPALAVENVTHAFGKVTALDQVSLDVPRGSFTALLGVNGAGKTTLFSLITRLYDNVTGSIRVAGHDVRRAPGPALARIGVVFQSRALDPGLTLRQNMAYHAALHGIGRAEARERGDALLARVGLIERADTPVAALSGGQVRRVEVARALLHGPQLLLLDEPTVGLDVAARRDVVRLVRALVAEDGVAVLWATHLFDEIEATDRLVVLHLGKVLARGTAAEFSGGAALADAFVAMTGTAPEAAA
ncbi:ATP-binding cassette domain-containing protein [Limibaculum sp. M0105]|uniref:ATP-binding cassette domain-containing protein n=1 Tax=Thermohalobaculum xanthum TaxID=2753746 RepID=A0A8J7SD67_9RHOB|nr:ATP-binding cassette domain-containing protein [Thermohalobaculum xanthum]MBK0399872.1 ATP-binding cassette domain-containing protein [Thermohalobaculum xanthum]